MRRERMRLMPELPTRRSAFTVVELLVCVFLTGLASSLLLPMLVQEREQARKQACTGHLRELAQACRAYAEAHDGRLPANRKQPYTGWNTIVLPYLEKTKLYERYSFNHNWWDGERSANRKVGATRVETFECPAAPHHSRAIKLKTPDGDPFQAAGTDYVASSGFYLYNNVPKYLYRGAMASPGRFYGASGVTAGEAVKLTDVTDGASQTILLVEMADKPNKWQAGKLAEDKLSREEGQTLVPSFSFGQWIAPNWNHLRSYDPDGTAQFGSCAVNCSNGGSIYGFHENGANVAFVDGSVHFLKAGLDQEIAAALVSIADGEVLSPDDY